MQTAVDLEPNFMPALLLLAQANLRTGAFRSASDNLFEVLEKDAGNVEAYILLPETARTSVEIEKAERLLERGQPFFKNNPGFNSALGSLYLKKGDLAKAEDSIKKALAVEPDTAHAHILMGDCLLREKDHDGAEREYKKAVELSPTPSMAHIKLAEFYLIDNNLAEGKKNTFGIRGEITRFFARIFLSGKNSICRKRLRRIDQTARRDSAKESQLYRCPYIEGADKRHPKKNG